MSERLGEIATGLRRVMDGFDADLLIGGQVDAALAAFVEIERLAAFGRVAVAHRAKETCSWARDGHRSAADWLAHKTGTSVGAAAGTLAFGDQLGEAPATTDAFRTGILSEAEAREIAAAAAENRAAEARLIGKAGESSHRGLQDECRRARDQARSAADEAERRRRVHRSRRLRRWTDRDGAFRVDGIFTADVGARLWAILKAEADRVFRAARAAGDHEPLQAYLADALAALADRAAGGAGSGAAGMGGGPKVVVQARVDAAALARGRLEPGEICDIAGVGPVSLAELRCLLDDAAIDLLVGRGADILNVSHLKPTVTAGQRRAIEARDLTCQVPGCAIGEHLQIHHITGRSLGGPTALDNLARVCVRHHQLITHAGWILDGPPGRRTWTHPTQKPGATSGAPPPGPTDGSAPPTPNGTVPPPDASAPAPRPSPPGQRATRLTPAAATPQTLL